MPTKKVIPLMVFSVNHSKTDADVSVVRILVVLWLSCCQNNRGNVSTEPIT